MAILMADDGREVINVNMVVNVFKDKDGSIVRQILNPLG